MRLGKIKTNLSNESFASASLSSGNYVLDPPTSNDYQVQTIDSCIITDIGATGISEGFILNIYWSSVAGALTVAHGSGIYLNSNDSFIFTADDVLTLRFDGNEWREVNKTPINGAIGSQGAQGSPGAQGVEGPQGAQGIPGLGSGPPGDPGDTGSDGIYGGANGSDGAQGASGDPGDTGAPGSPWF